jgi:tetratricopeptide (TPR) repeat protein
LRLKLETLSDAVARVPHISPSAEETSALPDIFLSAYRTHYGRTDDQADETEDAVIETTRILRVLRTHESSVPVTQVAADLEDLAVALFDLGMYADALSMYFQVEQLYRGSVTRGSRPAIIDAKVARALIGVSECCRRLCKGRSGAGLEHIEEAATIFDSLERDHPGEFSHELALALNNMSNHMRDHGKHSRAIYAAGRAVLLHRQLAHNLPEVHEPDLAASLLNASTCCSKVLESHPEALCYIKEAVEITRRLAADQPKYFEYQLAASLHNAANRRIDLGDHTEAYKDIQEALMIRRRLAMRRPRVFSHGLARTLTVACMLADKLGDVDEALRLCKETLNIDRTLAQDKSQFKAAESLARYSISFGLVKLGQSALPVRRNCTSGGIINDLCLATSLANVASLLGRLGDHDNALAKIEESMALLSSLAQHNPYLSQTTFARCLIRASYCYKNVGNFDAAMARVNEALEIRSTLGRELGGSRTSSTFAYLLAWTLADLSQQLRNAGHDFRAIETMEKSMEIYLTLCSRDGPSSGMPDPRTHRDLDRKFALRWLCQPKETKEQSLDAAFISYVKANDFVQWHGAAGTVPRPVRRHAQEAVDNYSNGLHNSLWDSVHHERYALSAKILYDLLDVSETSKRLQVAGLVVGILQKHPKIPPNETPSSLEPISLEPISIQPIQGADSRRVSQVDETRIFGVGKTRESLADARTTRTRHTDLNAVFVRPGRVPHISSSRQTRESIADSDVRTTRTRHTDLGAVLVRSRGATRI